MGGGWPPCPPSSYAYECSSSLRTRSVQNNFSLFGGSQRGEICQCDCKRLVEFIVKLLILGQAEFSKPWSPRSGSVCRAICSFYPSVNCQTKNIWTLTVTFSGVPVFRTFTIPIRLFLILSNKLRRALLTLTHYSSIQYIKYHNCAHCNYFPVAPHAITDEQMHVLDLCNCLFFP